MMQRFLWAAVGVFTVCLVAALVVLGRNFSVSAPFQLFVLASFFWIPATFAAYWVSWAFRRRKPAVGGD